MNDEGLGKIAGAPLKLPVSELQINTANSQAKNQEEGSKLVMDSADDVTPREAFGTGEKLNLSA